MKKGLCKKGHLIEGDNIYPRKDGFQQCRICTIERMKIRRNNPTLYNHDKERMMQRYNENKEKIQKTNRDNWKKNREKYNKQQRESFPMKLRILKVEVLTHYGNNKLACVCCGENELSFLTLDHKNGRQPHEKGSEMNRRKYSGRSLWSYVKREGFPEGYQTLCWNCNSGRQVNKGICPHKEVKTLPELLEQNRIVSKPYGNT